MPVLVTEIPLFVADTHGHSDANANSITFADGGGTTATLTTGANGNDTLTISSSTAGGGGSSSPAGSAGQIQVHSYVGDSFFALPNSGSDSLGDVSLLGTGLSVIGGTGSTVQLGSDSASQVVVEGSETVKVNLTIVGALSSDNNNINSNGGGVLQVLDLIGQDLTATNLLRVTGSAMFSGDNSTIGNDSLAQTVITGSETVKVNQAVGGTLSVAGSATIGGDTLNFGSVILSTDAFGDLTISGPLYAGGTSNNRSTLSYLNVPNDFAVVGMTSLDDGAIVTDGAGNVSMIGDGIDPFVLLSLGVPYGQTGNSGLFVLNNNGDSAGTGTLAPPNMAGNGVTIGLVMPSSLPADSFAHPMSLDSAGLMGFVESIKGDAAGDIIINGSDSSGVEIDSWFGAITSDSFASAITINCATTNQHLINMTGNPTLTFTNYRYGQPIRLYLGQDSVGGRTPYFNLSGLRWQGGISPSFTTASVPAHDFSIVSIIPISSGSFFGMAALPF